MKQSLLLLYSLICSIALAHNESSNIYTGTSEALYDLGCLYCQQKKLDVAVQYLEEAKSQGLTDSIVLLGIAYFLQNKTAEAERELKEAIEKGDNIGKFALALLYNNLDSALQDINKRDKTDQADLLFELANVCKEMGKFSLAEQCLKQAADKGNKHALYMLGKIYQKQHKFELAEQAYKTALEKDTIDSIALNYLGKVSEKQNKLEVAEHYLKQAL